MSDIWGITSTVKKEKKSSSNLFELVFALFAGIAIATSSSFSGSQINKIYNEEVWEWTDYKGIKQTLKIHREVKHGS